MVKTSSKKLLSIVLSIAFSLSIISSIPFSAKATYEAYFLDGSVATEATFILDPGHGNEETGALGEADSEGNQRREADDNLSMALKVAAELEAQGETVALTRITDKTVPLIERSHIANAGNYKIFCSLHRNSADNKSARGIETFYFNGLTADSSSAKIATKVHEKVMEVSDEIIDRKVKNANFSVLRETYTCAILIESLFVSNTEDNILYDKIESDLAVAIATGLIESKPLAIPDYMLDEKYAPEDLGESFIASITIPQNNLALTNNGNLNTVASTIDGSDSQLWKFEKVDGRNAYKLTSMLDQKCLDIESAKTDNLTNVMVWDDNGLDCQKYYFYKVNDKYCIRPKHCSNDRVIDINAVSLNAQLYDFNITNPNQQFQIVKVDDNNEDESSSEGDISTETSLELVENSTYSMENSIISQVKDQTTAEAFALNFKHEVIITDSNGNEISSDAIVGTGFKVSDKVSGESAEIVILGDVNGDGLLSATDYLQIKSNFLGDQQFSDIYKIAADVDKSEAINGTDYLQVKSHFLDKTNIYA